MFERKKIENKNTETSYWQSYSDMMAALLLVFVLIIAFTILLAKSSYEQKEKELENKNLELTEMESQLKIAEKEYLEQQKQMDEQQEKIDNIIGVRSTIIAQLREEFEDSDLSVSIDPESGAISFDASILFDYGKYSLKYSGKEFLNEFFPQYFAVIFSDEIKGYVAEVIIEGHTDNSGGYLYNLDLSQKRAFAVAEYCLGDNNKMFDADELERVRAVVTANGRAYYELIYDEFGEVDAEASRRVEVKFRLTEDEMIREMSKILEE